VNTSEKRGNQWGGEIKLLRLPSIYRVRGVVSRNHLEMTVAHFKGGACTLRRSEGDVFTEILRIVRGNRSLESTHFPEGLVLGNWVKTFHSRNLGVTETLANS
jgi:hypothetical protein